MTPNIHISMLAVAIAVIANFVFGFLWFTPIFGKIWAKEMKFDMTNKPPMSTMLKGMIFMVIGNFLMAYVFAHNMAVWDPTTWGLAPSPMSATSSALMAAVFTWLGFYFPVDLGSVAWEMKSWKLFFINTGYHLISLVIAAFVLVYVH